MASSIPVSCIARVWHYQGGLFWSQSRVIPFTTGAGTIFHRQDLGQNQASSAITQWDLLLFKQQNVGMITHHSNVLWGGGIYINVSTISLSRHKNWPDDILLQSQNVCSCIRRCWNIWVLYHCHWRRLITHVIWKKWILTPIVSALQPTIMDSALQFSFSHGCIF